jgi:hypothetical protein
MLGMLTAKSAPQVAFSNPKINVETLIAQIYYEGDNDSKQMGKNFK